MTSRSIVLGTAALLLLSAATPLQLGFSPTAAVAQEISEKVRAALSGNPAGLQPKELNERIRVLRDAIQSGAFKGADRQAAREKMLAYREAMQQHRAERQEAKSERQADPEKGQRTQRQGAGNTEEQARQAERDAERQAERKAERQAERKAERQAERKAERQAERKAEPQAQQSAGNADAGLSREITAALRDNRPASALEDAELRNRLQTLRSAVQSGALSGEQRRAARDRIVADREVLQSRRAKGADEGTTEQAQRPRRNAEETPQREVDQKAKAIISDKRSAADLNNAELRVRLTENREILGTGKLSRAEEQQLRQQLRADREELRGRVAERQEQEEKDQASQSPRRKSGNAGNLKDASIIIQERTPSDRLTERELEERIRVLSRALKAGNITVREAEVARLLIDQDRSELRTRLYADRDRRRDRWRDGSHDDVFIEFQVGYRPPPVIYAAEAMPRDIQMQLVAPPLYQTQRAYSVQEIATNHQVRETMPGIELDTLNFDFGSAEVRPEEIDKLDEIGVVIERVVAERPNEVFLIEGHTDAVGSDAANDVLSQQRAHAVVEALLEYYLIDPENLQTVGLGERYLKIRTPDPEEENRRVTVRRITPLLAGAKG